MSPLVHSKISVNKRGGRIEDYLPIHSFMDSTKEICSDNRHRILHTMWGIRRVIIPIFGNSLINSSGKEVNIKDLCEEDHILPDFRNKFIPTVNDFVISYNGLPVDKEKIKQVFSIYQHDKEITNLLLSPLSLTGRLESLLITHNSWFINELIPRIFSIEPRVCSIAISPSDFFDNLNFESWMDNGTTIPKSAIK